MARVLYGIKGPDPDVGGPGCCWLGMGGLLSRGRRLGAGGLLFRGWRLWVGEPGGLPLRGRRLGVRELVLGAWGLGVWRQASKSSSAAACWVGTTPNWLSASRHRGRSADSLPDLQTERGEWGVRTEGNRVSGQGQRGDQERGEEGVRRWGEREGGKREETGRAREGKTPGDRQSNRAKIWRAVKGRGGGVPRRRGEHASNLSLVAWGGN